MIWENIQEKIELYAPTADITFEKLAVTPTQIAELQLPTRPTKQSCHSRDWNGDESVELDAMPPRNLRTLVRAAITKHVDMRQYKITKEAETSERQILLG
jgi:hypothetical protein